MLDWFFKRPPPLGSKPAPKPARTEPATPAAAAAAPKPAPAPAAKSKTKPPAPDWRPLLQAALGDDTALLKLAQSAVALEGKLAAVAELGDEAALKQAERHFRNQDRRVHQLAKQRLNAHVALRETSTKAHGLIDEAQALLQDPQLPLNRLVELDRAWQALDASLLTDSLRQRWADLMQQLTQHTRERGERALQFKRWSAQAREAVPPLLAACQSAATGEQPRSHLAQALERLVAVRAAAPAEAAQDAPALLEALDQAQQTATDLDERLVLLEALLASPSPRRDRETGRPSRAATVPLSDGVEGSPQPAPDEAAAATTPARADEDQAAADHAEDATAAAASAEDGHDTPPGDRPAAMATDDAGPAAADLPQAPGSPEAPGTTPEPAEPSASETDAISSSAAAAGPATAPAEHPAPATVPPRSLLQQWQDLAPLPDVSLAAALAQRVAQWQQAQDEARAQRRAQQRNQARDQQRALRIEKIDSLAGLLDAAEAALDAGHLEETHQQLLGIDELLHGGTPDTGLRGRIDQIQARYAELKGWQHWAGGRARDELTQQAEALAAAVGGVDEPRTVKLSIQQQADLIDGMRARWKELDRLGGATSRALWQRFDSALKTAYEPVAAHLAKLRAAREQNLAARRQLLETLAAVPLPGEAANADETGNAAASADTPWRPLADALAQFHTEWRKLGPVEHTVPRKAQATLLEQMHTAVQRLETPLQQARNQAQGARELLIQRARTLAELAAAGTAGRDTGQQVRELQAAWQQQAKALPLQRGVENALWTEFKSTIDAIFSARDAAFSAREAEFKGHAAERQSLIERLLGLTPDHSESEIRRALAEIDQAWQRCGPAPRQEAAALDARWRQARDTAQRLLQDGAQRRWHAVCDTLQAKLALCEPADTSAPAAEDTAADAAEAGAIGAHGSPQTPLQARWDGLPELPPAWEQALRLRAGLAATPLSPVPGDPDDWLLQLEAAWDQPTPPEHQAARRQLKLQALKASLEGRRSSAAPPPELLLAELLRHNGLQPAQRARRDALLRALRERGGAYPAR